MTSDIFSASGMASGGSVLLHLKALVSIPGNCVVFTRFQAPGIRGDAMVNGADRIKVHGDYYPVCAQVGHLDYMPAHADYHDILR